MPQGFADCRNYGREALGNRLGIAGKIDNQRPAPHAGSGSREYRSRYVPKRERALCFSETGQFLF